MKYLLLLLMLTGCSDSISRGPMQTYTGSDVQKLIDGKTTCYVYRGFGISCANGKE